MGFYAAGAVLDSIFRIGKTSAAAVAQRIQRAIAEQAVEVFFLYTLMAGKIFTVPVLEKFVVLHHSLLIPQSTDNLPVVDV